MMFLKQTPKVIKKRRRKTAKPVLRSYMKNKTALRTLDRKSTKKFSQAQRKSKYSTF